jgi:hypothetical protein
VTGRVVLAVDDAGNQLAIGPDYTQASLERLRREVGEYGWTVAATVPHCSWADFTSARGRGQWLVNGGSGRGLEAAQ